MASEISNNYIEVLQSLKDKIRQARLQTAVAVNNTLLTVYWEIGNTINKQETAEGWGAKTVEKLAKDLRLEFPDMKGLSPRNLRYMRDFALAWPQFLVLQPPAAELHSSENQTVTILQVPPAKLDTEAATTILQGNPAKSEPLKKQEQIVQVMLAQLSWYHHTTLLDKVKDSTTRLFYIQKTAENGWTRDVMVHQIESQLHERQGALTNNFKQALPAYDSELATQLFKDPYQLDFIMLGEEAKERDLENALMNHITRLLLELGDGFAFMGRQKRFEAGGKEFFIDLLFYHTKLRRHIIIELKIGEFEPEFVSKMNMYLGIADDTLKGEYDNPAIGLILCKTKNKIVAEYALRDTSKPIGIAEYKIAQMLPEDIKGELPSIEEIETRLDEELKEAQSPIDSRLQTIKEKIKNSQGDEIQTPATFALLQQIYQNGLRVLYTELMGKMNVFEEYFLSKSFFWYCTNHNFSSLEQADDFWKVEESLKQIFDFSFQMRLDGFKKAGTEHGNAYHTLTFRMDTYHYSFTLVNYNNQQPFLKKLYHQPLTVNDRQQIADVMMNAIMDDIERILERINKQGS